jgi:hypothetical protein
LLLEQNRNKLPQSVAGEERKEKKMTGSTELMSGGASVPLATLPLLGAPPLIKGEHAGSYDQLLARICGTLRPSDSLEEIWIRDVVDLVWETFRLRRTKASLLTDSTEWGIGNTLGREHADAREMAREWAAGNEAATKDVAAALVSVGSSMEAVIARAMSVQLLNMERLDRLLVSAEARRSAALRELDYHRGPLAQKLRRAIADAEHAELAVDAPRIAPEAQPA